MRFPYIKNTNLSLFCYTIKPNNTGELITGDAECQLGKQFPEFTARGDERERVSLKCIYCLTTKATITHL